MQRQEKNTPNAAATSHRVHLSILQASQSLHKPRLKIEKYWKRGRQSERFFQKGLPLRHD